VGGAFTWDVNNPPLLINNSFWAFDGGTQEYNLHIDMSGINDKKCGCGE
jgi:hypothetical protein